MLINAKKHFNMNIILENKHFKLEQTA